MVFCFLVFEEEGVALLHHLSRLKVKPPVLPFASEASCLLVVAGCNGSVEQLLGLFRFFVWVWRFLPHRKSAIGGVRFLGSDCVCFVVAVWHTLHGNS